MASRKAKTHSRAHAEKETEAPTNFQVRADQDGEREDPKDPNDSNWDTEDGKGFHTVGGDSTGSGVDDAAAKERADNNIGSTGTNAATGLEEGAHPGDPTEPTQVEAKTE